MAYLIKKNHKTDEIIYMEYEMSGYKFTPKNKRKALLDVKEVTIINRDMINNILDIKFKKIYKKLCKHVKLLIESDDASESDAIKVFGEVELLKGILLNKYQHIIDLKQEKEFLKKLKKIENEIKVKIMMIRENKIYEEELEANKSHSL